MNICILTRIMPAHSLGGMQQHTETLAEGLVRRGHKAVVITTALDEKEYENVNGVEIHYLKNTKPGKYSRNWWRKSVEKFKELNTKEKFDVIYSESIGGYSVVKKNKDFPSVIIFQGTAYDEIKTQLHIVKSNVKLSDKIRALAIAFGQLWGYIRLLPFIGRFKAAIATSNEQVEVIKKFYLIREEKIYKVFNGIDTNLFSPILGSGSIRVKYNISSADKLLLSVARIEPDKGIQNIVRALPLIMKKIKNVRLMIVGEGGYLNEIKKIVKELNLEDHTIFVGFVPFEELPLYFNACDAYINPTIRQNGYDLTIIEAMACEKPVIVSNLGSVPTVITHNVDGILVQPGDITALSKEIIRLMSDEKLARKLGKAARKKVVEKFSLDSMVEGTIKVFKDVIEKRKAKAIK